MTDTPTGEAETTMTPKPGSYEYFAQEWKTFMRICDDGSAPQQDLDAALQGIFHLGTYSDDAPGDSPNTLEMLLRAAYYRYERAHLARGVEPSP